MKVKVFLLATLIAFVVVAFSVARTQNKPMTAAHNMSGMDQDDMEKRGDKVMGFDHTKTTHHFGLLPDGGTIEVNAIDPKDITSRDEIQKHLAHIAMMFAEGNFSAPMLIHAQNPPGVPVLQRLKDQIEYKFEKTELGGRVRITTKSQEALQALYDFLRFQIKEHKTGDPTEVG